MEETACANPQPFFPNINFQSSRTSSAWCRRWKIPTTLMSHVARCYLFLTWWGDNSSSHDKTAGFFTLNMAKLHSLHVLHFTLNTPPSTLHTSHSKFQLQNYEASSPKKITAGSVCSGASWAEKGCLHFTFTFPFTSFTTCTGDSSGESKGSRLLGKWPGNKKNQTC